MAVSRTATTARKFPGSSLGPPLFNQNLRIYGSCERIGKERTEACDKTIVSASALNGNT